jgi:hypothetical protein
LKVLAWIGFGSIILRLFCGGGWWFIWTDSSEVESCEIGFSWCLYLEEWAGFIEHVSGLKILLRIEIWMGGK